MTKNDRWPAWYYGPNGEAAIFSSKSDVPSGWADTPEAFRKKSKKEKKKLVLPKNKSENVVDVEEFLE